MFSKNNNNNYDNKQKIWISHVQTLCIKINVIIIIVDSKKNNINHCRKQT